MVVGVVVAVAAAARFNGLLRSIGLLEGHTQEQGAATFLGGGGSPEPAPDSPSYTFPPKKLQRFVLGCGPHKAF